MTNQEKSEYPYMPNQHVQFMYGDLEGSGNCLQPHPTDWAGLDCRIGRTP